MENVIHRLTLDLTGADMMPRVEVQQDNARTLVVSLTQGGRPYWIAEGVTAVFSGRKPDGNPLFNACTIEKNRVRYDFTDQTTNVAGIVECEILLYSGDERILASPRFELAIDELIHKDGDVPESAPEISTLTQMVAAGTAMIEDLREALAGLEGLEEILTKARAAAGAAGAAAGAAQEYAEYARSREVEAAEQAARAENAAVLAMRAHEEAEQAYEESDRMAGRASTAADRAEAAAKRAEEAATGGNGSGQNVNLTTAQITALDNLFRVCAFVKEDVSAEYSAFRSAFGIEGGEVPEEPDEPVAPTVTLTSISVTYAGGDVPVGTSVDDLNDIVVTAHYSDGSTAIVNDYTFSGTIAEGSNTITVTYQGKTATFTVTGVAESGEDVPSTPLGVEWTDGYLVSVSNATQGELTANATWTASDYVDVSGKTEVRIYNDFGKLFTFQGCFYDADKQSPRDAAWYFHKKYVQGSAAYPSPLVLAVPDGAKYVRLSTSIQQGSASAGYVRYDALTYELA